MGNDLAIKEAKDLTPMEMIQVAFNEAIKQGGALEVVDRILEQQKWMIQHTEEESFNASLKRIQKRLKKIPKRGWNNETKSRFATAEDIDDAIQELLDEENMTLSFRPAVSDKAEEVLIVGTLSLGAFCREYPLPMPADGKGPKGGGVMSRTHATGSAITYGKRYLKNMIFDLRFKEKDDDGNGAGAEEGSLDEGIAADWKSKIEESATVDELKKNYLAAAKLANEAHDSRALGMFDRAKKETWKKRGFRA